jgi:hypothetical protein
MEVRIRGVEWVLFICSRCYPHANPEDFRRFKYPRIWMACDVERKVRLLCRSSCERVCWGQEIAEQAGKELLALNRQAQAAVAANTTRLVN